MTLRWTVRAETPEDIPVVHAINVAAFDTPAEADLVDALRTDTEAWIDGLSIVGLDADGTLVAHVLLTRCYVDSTPALALAPVAVLPEHQGKGAGGAVIRASLEAAMKRGEALVLVLGHADYYPRFGFEPASRWGIRAPFSVPDEAMMALSLDSSRPMPSGVIHYASAFGV
ncbi:GNAT family N-acetyltransferase [Streptomyces sp. NPDC057638]|uniref:GNAT family N-acetyltransferase n=1 Tax=Streptomyces sp. NPDC057638 TaxID=3346190 RepID=UPI003694DAA4